MTAQTEALRQRLAIPADRLDALNALLLDPALPLLEDLLAVVAKYGTTEQINQQAAEAGRLPNLREQVKAVQPAFLKDLEWLVAQRDQGAFVSVADYRRGVAGARPANGPAVTLEVSAL